MFVENRLHVSINLLYCVVVEVWNPKARFLGLGHTLSQQFDGYCVGVAGSVGVGLSEFSSALSAWISA